ncbi:MAG TPA: STAS domain-containing protein [Alphaproteobacteria bacterium]|nr:STAS domain-containing protein [Alphaproteobacteria bacterium]
MATHAVVVDLPRLIERHEPKLLTEWLRLMEAAGILQSGRLGRAEVEQQSRRFVEALRKAVAGGNLSDIRAGSFGPIRELVEEIAEERAKQGFSASEAATFVLSLKEPLFNLIGAEFGGDPKQAMAHVWTLNLLLDKLGLHAMEAYQRGREEVIRRQQEEISELSTPVVQLWDGVLALPLIGTLDSARTQVVMENLLQRIVDTGAEVAIIDITGVPTVDTLVAQHLLKTIAAARLMGADCLISGIRPQIAQTIVHLGVELNVVSKATMADAFALALQRTGSIVVPKAAAKQA